MKLTLGPGLEVGAEDFVERATALIAKRGKGKTGGTKVVEEALLDVGLPFVVFDPVGLHWGLKSSFDGKKPSGYRVLVVGGEHADLPLDRKAGRLVARSIAEANVSLVVDFKGTSHAAYREFIADFADELLNVNRHPRLLIIEEAPRLLPQRLRPDQTAAFDAVQRLVLEGRNMGLGCILVSQRAATLNKDVLTQVDNLVIMGLTGPQDRKAVREWVELNAEPDRLEAFLAGLAALQPREAWLWAPDAGIFQKFRFRDFKTFHPDRTHLRRLGLLTVKPVLTDVAALVGRLGAQLRDLQERAKADDPKALRAELAKERAEVKRLQAELAKKPAPARVEARVVEKPFVPAEVKAFLAQLAKDAPVVSRLADKAIPTVASAPRPAPSAAPAPRPAAAVPAPSAETNGALTKGMRTVLQAIAERPGRVERNTISVLTSYKKSSRDLYIQQLAAAGYIAKDGDGLVATPAGIQVLGDFTPLPTGAALRDHWLAKLPQGERRVLEVAIQAHPGDVERAAVDDATGYRKSSRDLYIQKLAARRLIDTTARGRIRASDDLFG